MIFLKALLSFVFLTAGVSSASDHKVQDEFKPITQRDLLCLVNRNDIAAAHNVLKGVYESQPRQIINTHKYGMSFPINPEIMHGLMKEAPEKKILEIAGASGENSLLLAAAGAGHVYFNDITNEEVSSFENKKLSFSKEVQSKITSFCCDLFQLKNKIPEKTLDIILARNIFHFMKKSQYSDFFDVVSTLLKPNGKLVMNVNGPIDDLCYSSPDVTSFVSESIILDSIIKHNLKEQSHPIYRVLCTSTEDKDPTSYDNFFITKYMDKTINQEALKGASEYIQGQIKDIVPDLNNFQKLRVLRNYNNFFLPKNITKIVAEYEFESVSTCLIDEKGHSITQEQSKQRLSPFVCIIAKKRD